MIIEFFSEKLYPFFKRVSDLDEFIEHTIITFDFFEFFDSVEFFFTIIIWPKILHLNQIISGCVNSFIFLIKYYVHAISYCLIFYFSFFSMFITIMKWVFFSKVVSSLEKSFFLGLNINYGLLLKNKLEYDNFIGLHSIGFNFFFIWKSLFLIFLQKYLLSFFEYLYKFASQFLEKPNRGFNSSSVDISNSLYSKFYTWNFFDFQLNNSDNGLTLSPWWPPYAFLSLIIPPYFYQLLVNGYYYLQTTTYYATYLDFLSTIRIKVFYYKQFIEVNWNNLWTKLILIYMINFNWFLIIKSEYRNLKFLNIFKNFKFLYSTKHYFKINMLIEFYKFFILFVLNGIGLFLISNKLVSNLIVCLNYYSFSNLALINNVLQLVLSFLQVLFSFFSITCTPHFINLLILVNYRAFFLNGSQYLINLLILVNYRAFFLNGSQYLSNLLNLFLYYGILIKYKFITWFTFVKVFLFKINQKFQTIEIFEKIKFMLIKVKHIILNPVKTFNPIIFFWIEHGKFPWVFLWQMRESFFWLNKILITLKDLWGKFDRRTEDFLYEKFYKTKKDDDNDSTYTDLGPPHGKY